MSGFAAEWLALREPFDTAARAPSLVEALRAHCSVSVRDELLRIVDLGSGTGSNLRYLAPHLERAQDWRLVDNDEALLTHGLAALTAWAEGAGKRTQQVGHELIVDTGAGAITVRQEIRDLSRGVEDGFAFPRNGLVSASALLDLVSAEWLSSLVANVQAARAAAYFTLTYDGRTECYPEERGDELILSLFNRHQRQDKGFGPALGPVAAALAAERFSRVGYHVMTARSDWEIGADARVMQTELLNGWLSAACEIEPARRPDLENWHRRRVDHLEEGRSRLRVGHVDLLAWPLPDRL